MAAFSEVTIIYATNQAPNVNAGADQAVGIVDVTVLNGAVTDDGLPAPPAVTTLWTQEGGPDTATFGNANAVSTTVSFPVIGTYNFRLTANDGELENYDEVAIEVVAGSLNHTPVVDAGPDKTIFIGSTVTLNGTATDDGKPNPPGTITKLWTKESGPGTVTFGTPTSVNTTADFSAIGTYVLRLTADDTLAQGYDEVTVTVTEYTYEGYTLTSGGAGGSVVMVTNTASSGAGSLYAAITGLTGAPTIIKFAVAGSINTGGEIQINKNNVTIAGETAPAPGITLTGGRLGIKADDVIVRHIRSRNAGLEGIQVWSGHRIIIDHCSITGTGDGAIDINPSSDVVVSRCLIANCVEVHKAHGTRVSVHHNYYTTNNRRMPRVYEGGPYWDFRNNVVEYWTNSGGNILNSTGVNIISNIFGPPAPSESWNLAIVFSGTTDPNTVYTDGNYCEGKDIDAMGLAPVPNDEPDVITTDILADPSAFRDSIRRDCGALPRDSTDTSWAGPAGP
jgi:pectate lyase